MSSSKNQAVVDFLMECPIIQENPLYFNFADENGLEDSNHIISESDKRLHSFIDGSCLKSYTFTVATYKPVAFNAIIKDTSDQNIETMSLAQEILDWIEQKAENREFPDFGDNYVIEEMETLTSDPDLDGIDTSVNPPMVRYSIGVKIQYVDNTKSMWNK